MGTPTVGTFLRRLRQAMAAEALVGTSDRELVERFRADRDEAAFRALVERHGPMVFQVCNNKVRSRLELNDEQVKKIQEIADKGGGGAVWALTDATPFRVTARASYTTLAVRTFLYAADGSDPARADLIKVLSPQQREALERLSGMTLDPKK